MTNTLTFRSVKAFISRMKVPFFILLTLLLFELLRDVYNIYSEYRRVKNAVEVVKMVTDEANKENETATEKQEQTDIKKGGGKNDKHANSKKKESAKEKYENAKKELERLNQIPNKSDQEKLQVELAKRQVKHWKQKMDFAGENHSQKMKGN